MNGLNVYSVKYVDNNDPNKYINKTGNLYKISGYIIISNGIDLTGDPIFKVNDLNEKFDTNNSKSSTSNVIYIDDYFAFIKTVVKPDVVGDNANGDVIITPYGLDGGKFVPHHNYTTATNDNENETYYYILNNLLSTLRGSAGGTANSLSVAKPSITCNIGLENFTFNLMYNITNGKDIFDPQQSNNQ